uniref:Uncharacterized protein AlNc14C36G3190 n=1 Tax=Albugo laibachii Nc14 TaxID=890382 RepID=F0W8R4_9STRA|nr:conserved hypothetical protein [Albugo laibachii Nc14]|eukprot:CCA17522.1 conserved hypothetical protein [Albugo laibachii Nc14]
MDEETGENRQQTRSVFEEEQHVNHSGVLRVYELCNIENQSAEEAGPEETERPPDANKDTTSQAKRKKRKIKPLARGQRLNHVKNDPENRKKPKMIITVLESDGDDKEEASTNGQSSDKKEHDSDHDAWTDHNRWYCNLCKDGGELLCCDRCPRAFHLKWYVGCFPSAVVAHQASRYASLGLQKEEIPESEWYCKFCAYVCRDDCLTRRRATQESKEKARITREAERLERDAHRKKLQQEKEDSEFEKSMEAIEARARRIIEIQDRIMLSRKKVRFRDKEEEKLGKVAENFAESIRCAKDQLEKLEKEDTALRKKEEALEKRRKFYEGTPEKFSSSHIKTEQIAMLPSPYVCHSISLQLVIHICNRPSKCPFAGVPEKDIAILLAVFDCLSTFGAVLEIAPLTIESFSQALTQSSPNDLVREIHMCLLDLILQDREDEEYVSDVEQELDEQELCRHQLKQTPLSLGVPTSTMLNSLSWSSVLYSFILSVPRFLSNGSKLLQEATLHLKTHNHAELLVEHKLALLDFLISRAYMTEKLRKVIGNNTDQMMKTMKEYNRMMLQERRIQVEEEKRLGEKHRTKLAEFTEKKEASKLESRDEDGIKRELDAEEDELDEKEREEEELLRSREEELEVLQEQDQISRHVYVVEKKKLDLERDEFCKARDLRQQKRRSAEQLERKQESLKEAICQSLSKRDLGALRGMVAKASELGIPEELLFHVTHCIEVRQLEVEREKTTGSKRQLFKDELRKNAIRTEALGQDEHRCKYWFFKGDPMRLYIQVPSESISALQSGWYCYPSKRQVIDLLEHLDRKSNEVLRERLESIVCELPKESALSAISNMQKEDLFRHSNREETLSSVNWPNTMKQWPKTVHREATIQALQQELLHLHSWLSNRLEDRASDWNERLLRGRNDWLKLLENANLESCVTALLMLEREVLTLYLPKHVSHEEDIAMRGMMDEEEEEEDFEIFAEEEAVFWPSRTHRSRWIQAVRNCVFVADVSLAMETFVRQLAMASISEHALTPVPDAKGKRVRLERRRRIKEEEEEMENSVEEESGSERKAGKRARRDDVSSAQKCSEEWEEECYVCREGGQVVSCDGCQRVFHLSCLNIRRMPRGKLYCKHCSEGDTKGAEEKSVGGDGRRQSLRLSADGRHDDVEENDEIRMKSSNRELESGAVGPWDVECFICKLYGELLGCDGCPKAFHLACIGIKSWPQEEWFCDECDMQTCGVCGRNKIKLNSHVICGSEDGSKGCDKVFHLKCVKLEKVPESDWFCSKCKRSLSKALTSQ